MPGVRVSPLGPNNDNLNYIVQVGNVIGFIISIEMLVNNFDKHTRAGRALSLYVLFPML